VTSNLVVVAGQSNALGYGALSTSPPSWYVNTAQVQIWVDTNNDGVADAWNYMNPGVNTGTSANPTAWGPEVAFADAWVREHPGGEILWIVKSAKGETSLYPFTGTPPTGINGDWYPGQTDSGDMFAATTAKIAAAKANLGGTFDTTVLWFQGETDSNNSTWANAYGSNLSTLQSNAASQWGASRFLLGRINHPAPYNGTVQLAQSTGFNTDEFERQSSDHIHLTGNGEVDLGYSFWAAYDSTVLTVPTGTSGNDRYIGSTGADSGNDMVYGGPGDDWVHGNAGNDSVVAGAGNDTIYSGQGDDRVSLDDGDDYTQGNLGNDTLAGGWGNDTQYGGQGLDRLTGGQGADFLAGDLGNDTLTGGDGADRFYYVATSDNDQITDFNGGAGDRIQLEPGTAYSLSEVAGNTVITFLAGSATLQGVPLASFSGGWII
jgi:Ca2+-binding RTX toxin-like protein